MKQTKQIKLSMNGFKHISLMTCQATSKIISPVVTPKYLCHQAHLKVVSLHFQSLQTFLQPRQCDILGLGVPSVVPLSAMYTWWTSVGYRWMVGCLHQNNCTNQHIMPSCGR